MTYPYPDKRAEDLNLLIPGRKPVVPVALKPNTPFIQSVQLWGQNERKDLAQGKKGSKLSDSGVVYRANNIDFSANSNAARVDFGTVTLPAKVFTLECHISPRAYVSLAGYWGVGAYDGSSNGVSGTTKAIISFNNNIYFWGDGQDWDTGVAWPTHGRKTNICFTSDGTTIKLFVDVLKSITDT